MSLPASVRIMGKAWEVQEREMKDAHGKTYPHAQLILIHPDLHQTQRQDTLLHEIVHAIDHELDLDMTERQVRLLATGLLGVLIDNPKVRTWLFKKIAT